MKMRLHLIAAVPREAVKAFADECAEYGLNLDCSTKVVDGNHGLEGEVLLDVDYTNNDCTPAVFLSVLADMVEEYLIEEYILTVTPECMGLVMTCEDVKPSDYTTKADTEFN